MRNFTIGKLAQGLITPMEPTPPGPLPLSPIDSLPFHHYVVPTLFVFPSGGEAAARTIRQALAKALVHYYPLAGRFLADGTTLHVDCNGKGAWFVEANANCSLDDVHHLDHPCLIPIEELIFACPEDNPLLQMQVTQFTCGGFVVGVLIYHSMLDGIGSAQFLNAMAELARGLDRPTIKPVWLRDAIFKISKFPSVQLPALPSLYLHRCDLDIPIGYVNHVKKDYLNRMEGTCSTFDVSIALIWRSRARTIGADPDANMQIYFAANVRHLLSHVIPPEGGYYGNCYYLVSAMASSRFITSASMVEVVKLVKDAKTKLPEEFTKLQNARVDENPYQMKISYETLIVSDWRRIGLIGTNFGWGIPTRIIQWTNSTRVPQCTLGMPSPCGNNLRAVTKCVKEEHLMAFQHEMMKTTFAMLEDE